MVNKIDGSSNYIYTKQKKIDIPDTDQKFSLDYKNGEMSSKAKDKKDLSDQEKQQSVERGGVKLELSVGAQTADADRQTRAEKEKTKSEPGQVPLLETIRSYVMAAIAAVQEFFRKIWNDQPAEEGTADDGEMLTETPDTMDMLVETVDANEMPAETSNSNEILAETADTDEIVDNSDQELALSAEMDPGRLDREIQQSLRDGDVDQAISLLTDNGKRTVAKNSSLLTSYDKNGRVVEPGASVRERALHGDRNTWKL